MEIIREPETEAQQLIGRMIDKINIAIRGARNENRERGLPFDFRGFGLLEDQRKILLDDYARIEACKPVRFVVSKEEYRSLQIDSSNRGD